MRFLKKSQINLRNVADNSIAIQIDGEVTMEYPELTGMEVTVSFTKK